MSRIIYRSAKEMPAKSQIIIHDKYNESITTTDDESEHISLETSSEYTSESD